MEKHTLDDHQFAKLAKTEPNANVCLRLLMMEHLKQGRTKKEAADNLFVSELTVQRWFCRYQAEGLPGLRDKPKSGCPYKLPVSEHERFKARIVSLQKERAGGRVTGESIRQLLSDEFQAEYTLSGVYDLLHAIGMSWVSSRSQHPKQKPGAINDFKKFC